MSPKVNADTVVPSVPLGKYHPSQYKNKSNNTPSLNSSSSSSNSSSKARVNLHGQETSSVKANRSETPGGSSLGGQGHARNSSDVRRKLQQYQRDMVEQTAQAGRIVMDHPNPTSPRLEPLGSPGPVTPMALEESGGYLAAGFKGMRPAASSVKSPLGSPGREFRDGGRGSHERLYDAGEMVRRMIREEEERDRERERQLSVGD